MSGGNGQRESHGRSLVDNLPPQNLEAESGVLGSILQDNAVLSDVRPVLTADDFYRDAYQVVYRAMLALDDVPTPIDLVTLADELTRRGVLETVVGGFDALVDIQESVPHAANARYYAEIVRQKSIMRRGLEVTLRFERDARSNLFTAEQVVGELERGVFGLSARNNPDRALSFAALASEAIDRLDARKTRLSGVPSGFTGLDAVTDGFQPGQLVVVAGRPSMGKTQLLLNMISHSSGDRPDGTPGTACLLFSCEMTGVELLTRDLVARSGVYGYKFLDPDGTMTPADTAALGEAYAAACRAPVWVDDSPGPTVPSIAAAARRFKHEHNIGILAIDYLQLLEPENRRDPRHEQVALMSRRLKNLARELGIPVVVLSQINRKCEDREDRRPRMSDLRESGSVEQDADVVVLIHRPSYYDPNDRPRVAELIVAKNRNGPTKTVELDWAPELLRFSEFVPDIGPPLEAF